MARSPLWARIRAARPTRIVKTPPPSASPIKSLAYQEPRAWLIAAPSTEPSQTPARQTIKETTTLRPARIMSPSRASASVCKLNEEKVV